MQHIALMTSTIAPKANTFALKVIAPSERLQQYLHAFRFYIKRLQTGIIDNIVYVDNSGYALDDFVAIAKEEGVQQKIEFISYQSDINPKGHSRFFLELNLIDHFFKHSITLKEHPDHIIWKITGRYIIQNIHSIISLVKKRGAADIIINHRNYPYKVVDFYLIGINSHAYQTLLANNINDYQGKKDGEIILREHIERTPPSTLHIVKRMPSVPFIIGSRGFDGAIYGQGKDRLKHYVRRLSNRLLPFFWI